MKFKVDENLSAKALAKLRSAGHDLTTVTEEGLDGADDDEIAARLRAEGRAIVTWDQHFCDFRVYPPEHYPGIVVFRARMQTREIQDALTGELLALLRTEPLVGRLWIVEIGRVRILDRT